MFIAFPFMGRSDPLGERVNALKWVSDIIRTLGGFLPSWISQWFVSYVQYPATFLILAGVMGALIIAGKRVASAIGDRMTALWRKALAGELTPPKTAPSATPGGHERVLVAVRSGWRYYLGPAVSAIVIAYLGLTVGNRFLFTALDQVGLVCRPTDKTRVHSGRRRAGLL